MVIIIAITFYSKILFCKQTGRDFYEESETSKNRHHSKIKHILME